MPYIFRDLLFWGHVQEEATRCAAQSIRFHAAESEKEVERAHLKANGAMQIHNFHAECDSRPC